MVDGGSRKVTYSLPNELLREMEGMVREGAAPSYSAFVAEAVRERLERLTEQRLREAFAAAARDPLFLEDVEATTQAFAVADGILADGALADGVAANGASADEAEAGSAAAEEAAVEEGGE